MRRLLAIGVIWFGCALAWAVLGGTLLARSSTSWDGLGASVHALWGPPLRQRPPQAAWTEARAVTAREQGVDEHGRPYVVEQSREETVRHALPLQSTAVTARLALTHRRKGLLWFATYGVDFTGRYAFRNPDAVARTVEVAFPLEQAGVVYEAFAVTGADGRPVEVRFDGGEASFRRTLEPGAALGFTVAYRSRGTERWSYGVEGEGLGPEAGRARDVRIGVETDFADVDFPEGSLSPSAHAAAGGGWRGEWRFDQLVGTKDVAVLLPQRANPGPLAARLTLFAPVGLLFFFFVTAVLLAARRRSIHPMNYFLLATAFFAFHLLFAYLIDHLELAPSFAIASAVSLGLSASYARLFLGWRDALRLVGAPQLVYLVLFSVTFFWAGFTGLSITVGAILTLFTIMQLTGRSDWGEALRRSPPAAPPVPAP
jgi:hypothetical protein